MKDKLILQDKFIYFLLLIYFMEEKFFKTLPVDFKFDMPLSESDIEYQRAKLMLEIFKELEKRVESHPNDCPWCKKSFEDKSLNL